MKVKHWIAFVLCLLMLFSSLCIPVYADQISTGSFNCPPVQMKNSNIQQYDDSNIQQYDGQHQSPMYPFNWIEKRKKEKAKRKGDAGVNGFAPMMAPNTGAAGASQIAPMMTPNTVSGSVYGSIVLPDGSTAQVDLVDQGRADGKLSVFTNVYGTFTPSFGIDTTELILVNDTVVKIQTDGRQGTYIPTNGYVLSGTGTAKDLLSRLAVGDTVRIVNVPISILPDKYFKINGTTVPIDQINAARGAAEVILYQPSYGASTKTNPWGMEITVVGNKVTRLIGITTDPATGSYLDNNSPIPADGYVISIHVGSPYYAQLDGKIKVGDTVDLNIQNIQLYQAGKTGYDAYNPRTIEDNPAAWDDTKKQPFPGFRGADQLIIYDSSYGSTTGTNPWGYEVTVNKDGIVVKTGGNNSAIPAGGYVLSGHGVKALWLSNNALLGATVKLDRTKKEALVMFTPESYLDRAQIRIDAEEQALAESRSKFMDVPYAEIRQQIESAKAIREQVRANLVQNSYTGLADSLTNLEEKLTEAHFMNYESKQVENRGLWLRPKETNVEQVRSNLAKISSAHINSIYLETWWDGYTIFPTENKLTKQNPRYAGFDVLKAYIEEAKKLNIQVHAWVENFFVGPEPGPVTLSKPEWSIMSRKGNPYEVDPATGYRSYWLNPALPEVQNFLCDLYKELVRKYDVAGIHMDYTRYPSSGDYTDDFGYDPYTRNLFKENYGVDPINLHPGDRLWGEWVNMRVNIINDYVYRIAGEMKRIKPNLKFTAAVWPDYDAAPQTVLQDSMNWVKNNLIDNVFPMSYKPDVSLVVGDAKRTFDIAQDKSYVTIGVGTFIDLTKEVFINQIDASNRTGISGSAIFEFESLFDNGYDKELLLGVYKNKAIVPDENPGLSVRTMLDNMIRKMDEIYVPFQGMKDAEPYKKRISVIEHILGSARNNKDWNAGTATAARNQLIRLTNEVSEDSGLNPEVKNRMMDDLNYTLKIIDIYLAKAEEERN